MFIVVLKLLEDKERAKEFMEGHRLWIQKGIKDNIFVMVGSLHPENTGGCIIVKGITSIELEKIISQDPFVQHNVVSTQIFNLTPKFVSEDFTSLIKQ